MSGGVWLEYEKRRKEHPETHLLPLSLQKTDSSNLCCFVSNKNILIFAPFSSQPPANTRAHTRTHTTTHAHTHQPNPPTQAELSQDRFQTVYGCQAHAENYSQGILLLNTKWSSLWKWGITWVLNREGRYGLEKWHHVLTYQFQWLKEKHLAGLGSKKHKWS